MILFYISFIVFIINIPFGYWRGRLKKLSINWFIAIHLPIFLSLLLRLFFEIEFRWVYLIIFSSVFLAGQSFGKLIYAFNKNISNN